MHIDKNCRSLSANSLQLSQNALMLGCRPNYQKPWVPCPENKISLRFVQKNRDSLHTVTQRDTKVYNPVRELITDPALRSYTVIRPTEQ